MSWAFCNHCGAMWDDNHEQNGCPVMGTTARILCASPEEVREIQQSRKHRLKEWIRPVLSGRWNW